MSRNDEKAYESFVELIKDDEKLPRNIENVLLQRFFKVCESDPFKAYELLKSNLKLREKGPQIFLNRDVLSEEIQNISKILQFCPLPKLTSDNRRILFARFTTSDTSQYCCVEAIKMMLMMLDVRYIMPDADDNQLANADILVLDLNGYNLKHFLNAARNPKVLFLYFKYVQETVPVFTTAAHILNPSWVADRFMSLIRPILSKEVADSFRFHYSGLDSLYEDIPRELLPVEYGGSLGSIDEIHKNWMQTFEAKREYLLNDDNWKLSD